MLHEARLLMHRYLFSVLLMGVATLANAQDEGNEVLAREAFQHAEQEFAQGHYETALGQFRRALQLEPHDAVRFNVAVCLERLGRIRAAIDEYQALASSSQLADASRDRARATAADLARQLSRLQLEGEDAQARIGDQRCTLPCSIDLDPGGYRLEILVDGEPVHEEALTLESGGASTFVWRLPTPDPDLIKSSRRGMSGLVWLGASLTSVAAVGSLGFGLRTRTLHDRYADAPGPALRQDGIRMRRLTNTSLGLLGIGLLLITLDLVLSRGSSTDDVMAQWQF